MKSITACPQCSTQFYVDDEQLSQYKGKVRCGNCMHVFQAADYFLKSETPEQAKQEEPPVAEELPVVEENNVMQQQTTSQLDNIASFDFKLAPRGGANRKTAVQEEKIADETPDEELDGIHSLGDVDEHYIAKTESLIKNIDINDDVEAKIESTIPTDPALETKLDAPSEFSFNIDAPDNLDQLRSSREAEKTEEVNENISTASIAEPPEPMQDNFILPEPDSSSLPLDDASEPAAAENENYDFLLTEKAPTSPWKIILAITLILLLIGQGVYYFRDAIARDLPVTKPWLTQLCIPLGCEINLPKEINLLSIDDSGIQEDPSLKGVIRLTSTITNRAKFNQAFPNLEVTLTDEKDQPKVRRIFTPADYLPAETKIDVGIPKGDSVTVDMSLMSENVSVSGFRILLIY